MTTKFKGIPFQLGDRLLVVPPLNFRSLEELQDRLANFEAGVDKEARATIVDAAWHALRRNYPDITQDEIIDGLDIGNMQELMESVMDVSGLKRKAYEAAQVAGADPLTGPNSTPT